MKFSSRKDLLIYLLIFGCIAVMIAPMYSTLSEEINTTSLILLAIVLGITAFLLWMIFGTYYILTEELLLYHNGPIKGKIKLSTIHTIVNGKTLWVGFRPATANKGLIIKYGKYDEIYISPETNESFIAEILKRNPQIKIEDHTRKV